MKKLFRITSCRMMIYKHHVKSYYIATSHFTNILLYYNSSSFSQRCFLGQIFKYINKRKKTYVKVQVQPHFLPKILNGKF